jgi:hypothetical protein
LLHILIGESFFYVSINYTFSILKSAFHTSFPLLGFITIF